MTTTTLKAGYKMTEIGVIPEDWEVKELRDIVDFSNGKAHENHISDSGQFIVANSKFISTEGRVFKRSNESFCIANAGTILMVMSDIPHGKAIAKCFLVNRDNTYTVNQRICALKPKIDTKYLFYKINRNPFYLSFDDGVKQTNLKKEDVLNCKVSFPRSSAEQQAIAQVLSDTDELIGSLDGLIAKKRRIKEGAMQELLTGKKRLAGFSGVWEVKKLGEFLNYEQPTAYLVTGTEYNNNNQTPVLTAGKTFILGYTNEEHGIFYKLPVIIFDDFTTAIQFVDFPFKAKSSAMKMLIPRNDKVNMRFIYEIMLRIKYPLGDHKRHWIAEYQHLEITVPPTLAEQQAIAQILSDMDTEITALEQKREKYKLVKQGLMQVLLTGKIRLI